MRTSPAQVSRVASEPNDAASAQAETPFVTRFVDFWWVTIPLRLRRRSTLLWAAWSDGLYLTAWPRLATILVFAVVVFGFAEGATHWSFRTIVGTNGAAGNVLAPMATANNWGGPTHLIFADNLLLLITGVGLGTLSANLGITLVIAYALGDLFSGPLPLGAGWRTVDPLNSWIYRHVPLLTSYILFFMLTVLPILMAMELARSSHWRVARSKALLVGVTGLVEAALIYCWGAMAPMVFRTVQLWLGGDPRVTVPFYSHVTATWLVPAALIAVLVRAFLLGLAARRNVVRDRVRTAVINAEENPCRTPQWAQAIIAAGVITLLMMGFMHNPSTYEPSLFTNFGEAEVVFLGLAAALIARAYLQRRVLGWQRWASRIDQYPAVLRLASATAASYVFCLLLVAIGLQSSAPGAFGPELAAILVGVALALVLLPRGWAGLPASRRIVPWRRLPIPSRTTQAGIIGMLLMLTSKRAFADCYDFACCMASAARAAAAAAAGGIPGLSGIAAAVGGVAAAVGGALGVGAGPSTSTTSASPPANPWGPTVAQAWKGAGAAIGSAVGFALGGPPGAALGGFLGGVIATAYVSGALDPALINLGIKEHPIGPDDGTGVESGPRW
jgi:hypothetical protein